MATLGIPHPTGYPLYVLLGHLFVSLLPLGELAWRVNLFSALAAALAGGSLTRVGPGLGLRRPAAVAAGLILGLTPLIWAEALVARVYPLQALLAVGLLAATAGAWRRPSGRSFALAWGLGGLALANHTMALAQMVALAAVHLVAWRRGRIGLGSSRSVLAILPGLSLYAYLPWRSRHDPPLDWGNPEGWSELTAYLSRDLYWQNRFVTGPAELASALGRYLRLGPEQWGWIGVAALAVGLAVLARRQRALLALCLATAAVNAALVLSHGSRLDLFFWPRYLTVAAVALTVVLAHGLGSLADAVTGRLTRGGPAAAWALCLALPSSLLFGHHASLDRSRHTLARDYAEELLAGVAPGSALIAQEDNIAFPLLFLLRVEGRRPDLELLVPSLEPTAPGALDPTQRPIYATRPYPLGPLGESWRLDPEGLVFRLVPRDVARRNPGLGPPRLRDYDSPWVVKDFMSRELVGAYFYRRGLVAAGFDPTLAASQWREAARLAPDVVHLQLNLGHAWRAVGNEAEAAACFQRALEEDPGHEPARRALDRRPDPGAETGSTPAPLP